MTSKATILYNNKLKIVPLRILKCSKNNVAVKQEYAHGSQEDPADKKNHFDKNINTQEMTLIKMKNKCK